MFTVTNRLRKNMTRRAGAAWRLGEMLRLLVWSYASPTRLLKPAGVLVTLVLMAALFAGCHQVPQRRGFGLTVTNESNSWNTTHTQGQEIVTDHYQIFTTVKRRPLINYLPGYMEAAYKNYLDMTGLEDRTNEPLRVMYVMADREQWAALTEARLKRYSKVFLGITAGGYCYAGVCALWDIGTRSTLSVASHEGLHQFFDFRLTDSLPMWLEEGLCTQAEGHSIEGQTVVFTPKYNPSRLNSLRNAIVNQHWIPTRELLPLDGGDVVGQSNDKAVGYYGQVWALSLFLQSRPDYHNGMKRLISDAQNGKLHQAMKMSRRKFQQLRKAGRAYNRVASAPLFEHYISSDLETFDSEFKAFARELVGLKD